jgi:hypothetical protein
MRWDVQVAHVRDMRNIYQILVGKAELKGPLDSPRRRWEYNFEMDLKETGCEL